MVGIASKKDAPGVDFCGVGAYYYIVRADLNCYMQSSNFNKGEGLAVHSLHPSCRNGDHYLASQDGYFYIIKGNSYRRVSNLSTDADAVVYSLHPNCQGGDHYLAAFGHFYIIYQSRGVYRKCRDIHSDYWGIEYTLHPNCRGGIYYFGIADYYYFVKPTDEWGSSYYKCTNFNTNEGVATYSFHPSVLNFLPGGLALTHGPSFGEWKCIKTITNDSVTPMTWTKKVIKRIGFEKEKMSSIEHNWNVSVTASLETGGLASAIVKSQLSFKASYGGVSINTDKETWSQATETEESLSLTLKPNEFFYLWQYQLGLGDDSLLFCRHMKLDDDPNPPREIPLPKIQ
uniref:Uncharacterized protein n=1 Tax=Leptobrachium leishanense TaxID=445787 RepID=A0A8C5MDD9_9ANUR